MTTDTKRDTILRRVRAFIAKANATEFEAERQTFMAAADHLMETYAIEQWQLSQHNTGQSSALIVRRDLSVEWWADLRDLHREARANLSYLWSLCLLHCRCTSSWSVWDMRKMKAAVYGMPADVDYFDLLFTDLLLQALAHIRPTVDPSKSLGENLMVAKAAGMKWVAIARWLDEPDPDGHTTHTRLFAAYRKQLKELGISPREAISAHPDSWMISYLEGFVGTVSERLRAQRQERAQEQTMALVIRDVKEQSNEAMWTDFPELRPHPEDCQCPSCKRMRKPVRYNDRPRAFVAAAYGKGSEEGQRARIQARDRIQEPSEGNQLT